MEIYHDEHTAIVANNEYKFFYNTSVKDADVISDQMQSSRVSVRSVEDFENHLYSKGYEKVTI